jgi:hypothetical protein
MNVTVRGQVYTVRTEAEIAALVASMTTLELLAA